MIPKGNIETEYLIYLYVTTKLWNAKDQDVVYK